MITVKKLQTSDPFDGVSGGFCDAATLAIDFENDCTFAINGLNFTCTKDGVNDGLGALDATNTGITLGSNIVVGEITINSITDTSEDNRGGLAFGVPPAGAFGGFSLRPGTGAADGQYYDHTGAVALGAAVSITLPVTIQLIMDGNTNEISLNDGTNTRVIGTAAGLDVQANSRFYPLAYNFGTGGTVIDCDVNLGSSAFSVTPPVGFNRWCKV